MGSIFVVLTGISEGADGRTRTDDLVFTKHLLYQLSYIGRSGTAGIESGAADSASLHKLITLVHRHISWRRNANVNRHRSCTICSRSSCCPTVRVMWPKALLVQEGG